MRDGRRGMTLDWPRVAGASFTGRREPAPDGRLVIGRLNDIGPSAIFNSIISKYPLLLLGAVIYSPSMVLRVVCSTRHTRMELDCVYTRHLRPLCPTEQPYRTSGASLRTGSTFCYAVTYRDIVWQRLTCCITLILDTFLFKQCPSPRPGLHSNILKN